MSADEHSNMEIESSPIDSAAVDSATAAAATAMSDLSDQPSAAIAGQPQRGGLVPTCSKRKARSFCAPVCCASLWVGAPHVSACPTPRVDTSGKQACELCGTRLSTVKHHRPHGAGRACKACLVRMDRGTPAAPVVSATPVRSHKRKAGSDPGQLLPVAAAIAASLPLPAPLSLFAHSRWLTHQCCITPGSRRSRTLVHSWLALLASGELREWEEKRGGFWQHVTHKQLQCSYEDDRRVKLLAGTGQLGRALLAELGVDSTEAALQLGDVKVLRTSCGHGQQEIHYDIVQYAHARRCYTIILYLTSTLSTALPTLPLAELRGTFTDNERKLPIAEQKKLQRDQFITTHVEAGDALVLNCAVPHWGDDNPDAADRYVVFASFSPSSLPPPDTEHQRYPLRVKP
jgi:hypothetical protein